MVPECTASTVQGRAGGAFMSCHVHSVVRDKAGIGLISIKVPQDPQGSLKTIPAGHLEGRGAEEAPERAAGTVQGPAGGQASSAGGPSHALWPPPRRLCARSWPAAPAGWWLSPLTGPSSRPAPVLTPPLPAAAPAPATTHAATQHKDVVLPTLMGQLTVKMVGAALLPEAAPILLHTCSSSPPILQDCFVIPPLPAAAAAPAPATAHETAHNQNLCWSSSASGGTNACHHTCSQSSMLCVTHNLGRPHPGTGDGGCMS